MVNMVRKKKNGVPRKKPTKRRVKKGEKAYRGKDGKLRKK